MTASHILILAAGQGKRMHSQLPKVLHPILFRPLIKHVLDLAYALPHQSISLIVGHGEALVRKECGEYSDLKYFVQKEQKGTAHAVSQSISFLQSQSGTTLILCGDVPLLKKDTVEKFLEEHEKQKATLSLLSTHLENPTGYGRILRGADGNVKGIREEVDCSPAEKKITEINASIYCCDTKELVRCLPLIKNENRQKEFYLTDIISLLIDSGKKVVGFSVSDSQELLGINDRLALSHAETVLQKRTNESLMLKGVSIQQPSSVFVDPTSKIDPDVSIGAGAQIIGSRLHSGVRIESGCFISLSEIHPNAHIKQGSYLEKSEVGPSASVGPYAHLRPGSVLKSQVKVGNFVEVKKSILHDGVKASHLSYIGDAEIGAHSNIGCGFITCNYDGKNKYKTTIGEGVFIGSDSQTVAPVEIGKGSYVASGTTVTENVPEDSLVLGRTKQITKPGYAKKYQK